MPVKSSISLPKRNTLVHINSESRCWPGGPQDLEDIASGFFVCEFCRNVDGRTCSHRHNGWRCTRNPGHAGVHVACSWGNWEKGAHWLAAWDNDGKTLYDTRYCNER